MRANERVPRRSRASFELGTGGRETGEEAVGARGYVSVTFSFNSFSAV